jgi:hypothetical protein
MTENGSLKILVWGPPSAGKTVFLAYLYLGTKSAMSDWTVFAESDTENWVQTMRENIWEANRFPPPTKAGADHSSMTFTFRNRRTGKQAELATDDRPGAESLQLQEERLEEFRTADALMLVVDHSRGPKLESEMEASLAKMYRHGGGKGKVDQRPIAVCLSKSDMLINSSGQLRQAIEDSSEFVRDCIGPSSIRWISDFCPNHKLFAVSAIGLMQQYGWVRSPVFCDERLDRRVSGRTEPLNLLAPIEWIFEKLS